MPTKSVKTVEQRIRATKAPPKKKYKRIRDAEIAKKAPPAPPAKQSRPTASQYRPRVAAPIPGEAALIAKHRTRLGMTREDISEICECSKALVDLWERGKYAPRGERRRRLWKLLGLPVKQFSRIGA